MQWANSIPSSFDPAKDLQPLLHAKLTLSPDLPVNVFTRYLKAEAPEQPEEKIRSVANLYQTVLELERDGDLLQDLYRFYIALKLPVYVGQLGLPGSDADFLAAAQKLAGKSCASPVDLSVPAWQIAGRKVWNWGEKNLHVRDRNTLAKELLAEPQIAKLIPAMKAMPAEKIAIIGHSFTMDAHWSSPSSFVPIVTTMFEQEDSRVQFRQWSAGGLRFARAYRNYYAEALAWKPNVVLFVLGNSKTEDAEALKTMAAGFRAAGARVLMFDDVEDSIAFGEPSAQETEHDCTEGRGRDYSGSRHSRLRARSCLFHLHGRHPQTGAVSPADGVSVVEGHPRHPLALLPGSGMIPLPEYSVLAAIRFDRRR